MRLAMHDLLFYAGRVSRELRGICFCFKKGQYIRVHRNHDHTDNTLSVYMRLTKWYHDMMSNSIVLYCPGSCSPVSSLCFALFSLFTFSKPNHVDYIESVLDCWMPKIKRKTKGAAKLAPVAPAVSEDDTSSDDCMDMLEEDMQGNNVEFLAALNP